MRTERRISYHISSQKKNNKTWIKKCADWRKYHFIHLNIVNILRHFRPTMFFINRHRKSTYISFFHMCFFLFFHLYIAVFTETFIHFVCVYLCQLSCSWMTEIYVPHMNDGWCGKNWYFVVSIFKKLNWHRPGFFHLLEKCINTRAKRWSKHTVEFDTLSAIMILSFSFIVIFSLALPHSLAKVSM